MPRQSKMQSAGTPAPQASAIVGEVQAALVLAGSTAADAALITGECVLITSGTGGAALPPSTKGDQYLIKNESGNTCTLYPSATAGTVTINATTSLSVATAKSVYVFFSSATACHTIPTVAS